MNYVEENQILLNEEILGKSYNAEDPLNKATIRFRENIRLVYDIVNKFSEPVDPSISMEDILQIGYYGLWKSCLTFDETRGIQFSTYAYITIKGYILTHLRDNTPIKLPRVFKLIRSAIISNNFSLPLSEDQIDLLISEYKFTREDILDYTDVSLISLDYEIPGSDTMLGEIIPDPRSNVERDVLGSDIDIDEAISNILECIPISRKDLVKEWIYSCLNGEKLTQQMLSDKYNISQCQVSRVLKKVVNYACEHKSQILNYLGGYL